MILFPRDKSMSGIRDKMVRSLAKRSLLFFKEIPFKKRRYQPIQVRFYRNALLKYYTRDLQEVFIVAPVDSVYQDLVGDHNSVPEDCKCAREHSEHLLDVHGSVPDNRYAQKSSISRSHFGEGGGASVHLALPLTKISGMEL